MHYSIQKYRPITPPQEIIQASSFPQEILLHLFSFLSFSDWIQTSLTCRSWRIASLLLLWNRPKWSNWESFKSWQQKCIQMPGWAAAVTAFSSSDTFSYTRFLVDQDFLFSVYYCKHLKVVNLSGCFRLTDTSLSALIHLQKLVELDLSFTQFSDQAYSCLVKLPQLTHLSLAGCQISETTLQILIRSLEHLSFLNLNHLFKVSDVILRDCCRYLRKLEELSLIECWNVSQEGIHECAHLHPQLKQIWVANKQQRI
jgi:hypothetical protein